MSIVTEWEEPGIWSQGLYFVFYLSLHFSTFIAILSQTTGTSLVVPWLGLRTPEAGGLRLILVRDWIPGATTEGLLATTKDPARH